MIKFIALITRKDGMTFDAFDKHWREVHGPLIAKAPGLRRYVQSHLLNDLGREYPQAFDGMSEAWFDDMDAFVKAFRSDAWAAAVADVPNFMRDRGKWLLTTEVPIIDAYPTSRERESLIKYAGFLHMKRGLTYEQFAHHWRDIHGPLVAAEFTGMVRYIQSMALPETYGGEFAPAYDGVPLAWAESVETYPPRLGRRAEGGPTTEANRDSFEVFEQPIPSIICREVVIVE